MQVFREVREPGTGKLLCRLDVERQLLEIQRRGIKTLIDLTQYREQQDNEPLDNSPDDAIVISRF